jgi:hypothetical protein
MRGCCRPVSRAACWATQGAGVRDSWKRCAGLHISAGLRGRAATRPRGGTSLVLKLGRFMFMMFEGLGRPRVPRRFCWALSCWAAWLRDMASWAAWVQKEAAYARR